MKLFIDMTAFSPLSLFIKITVLGGIPLVLFMQFNALKAVTTIQCSNEITPPSDAVRARDCSMYDFVFIAGTGRSGSTTLMTYLNSIPGVYLSGENGGQVSRLQQLHHVFHNPYDREMTTVSWTNSYNISQIEHNMREIMINMINPPIGATMIGFKEIRFKEEDFGYLRVLFPCAKFILSIREDVSNQAKSAFHRKEKRTETSLLNKNELLINLSMNHSDYMHLIKLEEFSIDRFDELLSFLGRTDCKTLKVPELNMNGGYTHKRHVKKTKQGVVKCSNTQLSKEYRHDNN